MIEKDMSPQRRAILYHQTSAEEARTILNSGFSDSAGYFQDTRIWTGVWFSSTPPGPDWDAPGNTVLTVKLEIDDSELARWEWTREGRNDREWLIPANIINRSATVELIEQSEYATVGSYGAVDHDLCPS